MSITSRSGKADASMEVLVVLPIYRKVQNMKKK